jgi:hypothetical protein
MKYLTIILTFLYLSCFSQEKIKFVTGFSGSFEKELISNKGSQLYGVLGVNAGVRLHQKKGDLEVFFSYEFSSNVLHYRHADSTAFNGDYYQNYDVYGNEIDPYNSLLRSHFLGGGIKYLFRERKKTIRPFIKIHVLTEVSTNYHNGFLLQEEYLPKNEPWGDGETFNPYYSHFYHSTPIVTRFQGGVDIMLIQNLNLNIALGYGFRVMKVKYAEWKESEDVYEKLKTIPTENISSQMLDVQIGFAYVFPRKPKP